MPPRNDICQLCRSGPDRTAKSLAFSLSVLLMSQTNIIIVIAQLATPPAQDTANPADAPRISSDQLNALVAPIALYPDPILSPVLVASTYPIESNEGGNGWSTKRPLKPSSVALGRRLLSEELWRF